MSMIHAKAYRILFLCINYSNNFRCSIVVLIYQLYCSVGSDDYTNYLSTISALWPCLFFRRDIAIASALAAFCAAISYSSVRCCWRVDTNLSSYVQLSFCTPCCDHFTTVIDILVIYALAFCHDTAGITENGFMTMTGIPNRSWCMMRRTVVSQYFRASLSRRCLRLLLFNIDRD